MLVFRKRMAGAVAKTGVPLFLPFLVISVPLIVLEEDINCMPAWCGRVIIPPTLPFLFLEILILGLIAVGLRIRRVFRLVLAYCVFGVGWELTVGGLKGAPLGDLILVPYVALSYAFVSMLPLEVLLGGRRPPDKGHLEEARSAAMAEGRGQAQGKGSNETVSGAAQALTALLILTIILTTILLGILLNLALSAATGVRLVLRLPLLGRAFGALPILAGLLMLGYTFMYRKPRDVLASTSISMLKLLRRMPLAQRGGRTEPFIPRGPYRWVRNPMYFGVVMFPLGLGIAFSSVSLLLWGVVLVCWFTVVLIPHEERELEVLFGESYAEYKRQVPMLFPTGRRYRGKVQA